MGRNPRGKNAQTNVPIAEVPVSNKLTSFVDCLNFFRGNWQSIDVPQTSGMSVTEHYDIFPTGLPLTSRKSSSSTDSSSCLSIHSRSTTSSSERGSDSFSGGGVR